MVCHRAGLRADARAGLRAYDDDAGQSSDISVVNPQYLVVAVGW